MRTLACLLAVCFVGLPLIGQETPPPRQVPWTSSKIQGSPAPPLPYTTQRVFTDVQLDHPTDVVWLPEAERWIATQLKGQIVSFENDPENATAVPCLDLNDCHDRPISQGLAIQFHHDLAGQPWCFVTYSFRGGENSRTMLVRFKVLDPTVPTIDLASRVVLAQWSGSGHTGGSMQFGPDGMFYVSIGDGQPPYPPDANNNGQD